MSTDATSLVFGLRRNFFLGSAMRIAGAPDEILKNIIVERVLGPLLVIHADRDIQGHPDRSVRKEKAT